MSITVTLRYQGQDYTFVDEYDYQPSNTWPTGFAAAEWMYTEGNYVCDCNRSQFLADHCGVDFSDEDDPPLPEGEVYTLECGREIQLVRLDDVEYIYDDSLELEIPVEEYQQRHSHTEYVQRPSGLYVPEVRADE